MEEVLIEVCRHQLHHPLPSSTAAMGSKQWSQICDSTGVYLASVLGQFCLQRENGW
jgi:hypothetical protein